MTDTPTLLVADSNVGQVAAWDGGEGAYWATHAEQYEDSTAAHRRRLLAALELRPDSRVLDVGCGTGQATREVAAIARSGSALGVDLSARMLDVARRRAAADDLTNVTFEQADAQIRPFRMGGFDVVLGLTSAMFFGDKREAFTNLARALRRGGQLALIVWQRPERNPWFGALMTALAAGRELSPPPPDGPHPFSMTDPRRVRPVLEDAGLADVAFEAVAEPIYFGTDARTASEFILGQFGWLLNGLDQTGKSHANAALLTTMRQHTTECGVQYPSLAWLVTAYRA